MPKTVEQPLLPRGCPKGCGARLSETLCPGVATGSDDSFGVDGRRSLISGRR